MSEAPSPYRVSYPEWPHQPVGLASLPLHERIQAATFAAETRERIYLALLKRYEGDPAYDADFILAAAIKAAAWIVDATTPVVEEARQMPFEINRFGTAITSKES